LKEGSAAGVIGSVGTLDSANHKIRTLVVETEHVLHVVEAGALVA